MFSNQKVERRPATHLLNILKETSDHHPNFCLFLGAGTSASSGIKTAGEMIRQWRREFHEMYGEEGEGLYDEPSQRREYIESACVKARPSWGYIYLVNLLANNVFNTIFTTNFDDLLNEACYLYSDSVRPIVCAHDSSIRYVRLTSRRPKVIKLHGDFLFDNIKNTVRELETLEDNMKEKFRQYATEFGLIVIGYSGADRSIMDPLKTLVRSEEYFPHGIYWCVRKGEEVSRSVESLCESDKVHLIEISGFDELIADMHERLDYPLQRAVSDPFGSTVARLNSLIHAAGIPTTGNVHPIIARDIAALGHKISDGGGESGGEALLEGITNPSRVLQVPPTPYRFLAQVSLREGNVETAYKLILQQLELNPTAEDFDVAFQIVNSQWIDDLGMKIVEMVHNEKEVLRERAGMIHNFALALMDAEKWDLARNVLALGEEVSDGGTTGHYSMDYHVINLAQTYLHEKKDVPDEVLTQIKAISESPRDAYTKFGCDVILENWDQVGEFFETESIHGDRHTLFSVPTWPIFRLVPESQQSILLDRIRRFRKG